MSERLVRLVQKIRERRKHSRLYFSEMHWRAAGVGSLFVRDREVVLGTWVAPLPPDRFADCVDRGPRGEFEMVRGVVRLGSMAMIQPEHWHSLPISDTTEPIVFDPEFKMRPEWAEMLLAEETVH